MPTQRDELLRSALELEASLAAAPPEMRPIVEQQIQAVRSAAAMLEAATPQMEEMRRHRAPVVPELAAFFTPVAPPAVPAWLPDTITRGQLSAADLRCPSGASLYDTGDVIGCALPRGPGSIPIRHGLQLHFMSTGALQSQSVYEQGLLRWAVHYHATGGRSTFGFYADREPRVHLAHGLHTWLASNGAVVSQSEWQEGRRHGWTKLWEDDGHPIGATRYEHDRQVESRLPDGRRY
jgi:hypothetical protein